ncbi:MAG: DUF4398 domain-containing protein, partial [Spirochaetaceae bacterium]|nr:DUF4398 domain-containing protein [Spirochaetaceae bacterium]
MKKTWIYITLLILILLLSGCASEPETPEQAPEETPQEEIVTPETPVEEPPVETSVVETVEPVSAEEILTAEKAVARAEYAGASDFSPDLFLQANEDLEEAKSLSEKDPDKARLFLASSIEKADQAYEESVNAQVEQKIVKLRKLESELKEIEAEKFAPEDYQIVK